MFKVIMTLGDLLGYILIGIMISFCLIIFLIIKWEEFKINRRNKKKN